MKTSILPLAPRRLGDRILLAFALVVGACGDSGAPVAPDRTVDAGGGVVATLHGDGSLVVKKGDAVVLASPPGTALFARAEDPDAPDDWHDPTQPPQVPWSIPGTADVTLDPLPEERGVHAVHLVLGAQPATTALVSLAVAADDGVYTGLGERFDHVDARGLVVPMHMELGGPYESGVNDAHVPVPFVVSSKGWGMFVASREAGAFDVASTDPGVVRATFEGRSLDVTIFVADDPLAIVARFARATGLPRPLPRYALAPMHWRNEWSSADVALGDANELRRRHIPASTFWFDNPWQTGLDTFRFDTSRFADPAAMIATLQGLGFSILAWTTPYEESPPPGAPPGAEAQQLFADGVAQRAFVVGNDQRPILSPAPIKNGGGIVDFTGDAGRAFWGPLVDRATQAGVRGFKVDYGEDFVPNLVRARLGVRFADGTTERTARAYPLAMHQTYRDALDRAAPGQGILIVRASAYGGAAHADIVWPGDLDDGFQRRGDPLSGGGRAVGGLPAAVVAMQSLATSGFPYFGSDTGGYRGGMPTKEALLRWAEHTALSMILQLGGGGDSHDPWAYDEDAATIYAGLARLHMALVPYLAALAHAAETDGTPTVRPLPLAFPSDAGAAARADDEYMLGPDLLVMPVLDQGATSRAVHVPPGTWVSWWDGATLEGPADTTRDAPLGQPPLFARAGAIVPMLPDGVDTLLDATAPGVVSASQVSDRVEARAWVKGDARVELDDGGAIAIGDGADGTTLAWMPGSVHRTLTATLDLRARTGRASPAATLVPVSGDPPAAVADEAAVRASTASAWALDAARGVAFVRLAGGATVRLD